MIKKQLFLPFLLVVSLLLYTSCVKDVKDALEDLDERTRCAELLSEFTTNGGNQTCAQQIADINKILNDCNEFLTQEQKDELNFAKDNCSDN